MNREPRGASGPCGANALSLETQLVRSIHDTSNALGACRLASRVRPEHMPGRSVGGLGPGGLPESRSP